MSPDVGPEMGQSEHVGCLLRLLESVSMHLSEELMLNTVRCIYIYIYIYMYVHM